MQRSRVGAQVSKPVERNLLVKVSCYGRYGFLVKSIVYDINEIEFRYILKVVTHHWKSSDLKNVNRTPRL